MSDLGIVLGVCAVLIVAAAARYLPRRMLPDAILSDAYLHLAMSREIRRNGHRIPARVPRVELSPDYTYPYLYHWLLSWVPDGHVRTAERWSGALADTAYTALAFIAARALLPQAGVPDERVPALALVVALLVAFHPALLAVGVGPRAYSASPRPVGQLVFLAYIAACAFYEQSGDWQWVFAAVAWASLMPVTSKFGMQAMFFIAAGLALFGFGTPLLAAAGGVLAGIVWTRGRALAVIRGQLAHSSFYFRFLQRRYLHPSYRSLWQYVRTGLGRLRRAVREPTAFLEWFLTERQFLHRCLVFFPHACLLAALLLADGGDNGGVTMRFLLAAVAVSFVVGLLTALKPLMFLGEPERYPEHTVVFQLIALVVLLDRQASVASLGWLFAYSIAVYALSARSFVWRFKTWNRFAKDVPLVVAAIDRPGAVVLAIGGLFWAVLYFSRELKLYFHGVNIDQRRLDVGKWLEIFGNFPFPGVGLAQLRKLAGIDYVIGTKAELEYYAQLVGEKSFPAGGGYPLVKRSGEVMAFALNPIQS